MSFLPDFIPEKNHFLSSAENTPFFAKGLHDARGLLITGTTPRCGKTVAAAGLAGVLHALGFQVQAIKPLEFLANNPHGSIEQAFFDRLIRPLQPVDTLSVQSAASIVPVEWQRFIDICLKRVYPYLLEAPGNFASPLRYVKGDHEDAIHLANTLEIPMLLVTPKQPDIVNTMAQALTFAQAHNAPLVGWIAVETQPLEPQAAPDWFTDTLYLNHRFPYPYLGEIPYSRSISVESGQQGNLYRHTEMGLDLLPIQQSLDVSVPY